MIINSTTFGTVTVDNITYDQDIYIFASGEIQLRDKGHKFTVSELNLLLKDAP